MGKIAVEGASLILTPKLLELRAAGAAAKGILPEAASKIDSAMIRSLEKGVKEGANRSLSKPVLNFEQ